MKQPCPFYSWVALNHRGLPHGRINAWKVVLSASVKASALVPGAEFHGLGPLLKNVFFSG